MGLVLAPAGVAFDLSKTRVHHDRHPPRRRPRPGRRARLESPADGGHAGRLDVQGPCRCWPRCRSSSSPGSSGEVAPPAYAFVAAMFGKACSATCSAYHQRPDSPLVGPRLQLSSGHSMGSMLFFGASHTSSTSRSSHHVWRVVAVVACALAALRDRRAPFCRRPHFTTWWRVAAGLCWMAVCLSGTEGWVRWHDYRRVRREAAWSPSPRRPDPGRPAGRSGAGAGPATRRSRAARMRPGKPRRRRPSAVAGARRPRRSRRRAADWGEGLPGILRPWERGARRASSSGARARGRRAGVPPQGPGHRAACAGPLRPRGPRRAAGGVAGPGARPAVYLDCHTATAEGAGFRASA